MFLIDIGLAGAFVERAEALPVDERDRDPLRLAGVRDPLRGPLPRGLVAPGGGAARAPSPCRPGRGCSSWTCRRPTASACARCSSTTAGRTPASGASCATGPRPSARATTRPPAESRVARVRVVLVRPETSANVGACARVVRNTGAVRPRPRRSRGLAHRRLLADGLGGPGGARGGPGVRGASPRRSRGVALAVALTGRRRVRARRSSTCATPPRRSPASGARKRRPSCSGPRRPASPTTRSPCCGRCATIPVAPRRSPRSTCPTPWRSRPTRCGARRGARAADPRARAPPTTRRSACSSCCARACSRSRPCPGRTPRATSPTGGRSSSGPT